MARLCIKGKKNQILKKLENIKEKSLMQMIYFAPDSGIMENFIRLSREKIALLSSVIVIFIDI